MKRLSFAIVALLGCEPHVIEYEAGRPCACASTDEVCRDGLCVVAGSDCTPSSGCRAPYVCGDSERGSCTCDPTPDAWRRCAPRCQTANDCALGQRCDETRQLCEYPMQCITDDACGPAEVCRRGAILPELVWDGNSGYWLSSRIGRTCVAEAGGEAGDSGALEEAYECATAADCDGADCVYAGQGMACEGAALCSALEFRAALGFPACWIHQQCRDDEDCTAPYTCRLFGAETSGYCGREP